MWKNPVFAYIHSGYNIGLTYSHPKGKNMKRINFYVPESYLQRLAELSDGRPLAELIRQAVADYIERNGVKKSKRPRMVWDKNGNVIE